MFGIFDLQWPCNYCNFWKAEVKSCQSRPFSGQIFHRMTFLQPTQVFSVTFFWSNFFFKLNYSIYHVFVRFWEIFFLAHFLFFQESMIFIGDGLALIGPYIQSEKNQSKSLTIDFWLIGDSKIGDFSLFQYKSKAFK